MSDIHVAYLGLGSNLRDPVQNIQQAVASLNDLSHIMELRVSNMYRSRPWGNPNQPDFVNAAAQLQTALSALELLQACLALENELGRVRNEKWGPRIIDIDLLLYNDCCLRTKELVLPHPHLSERLFVLQPLVDLNPNLAHPANGKLLTALIAAIPQQPGDLIPLQLPEG